MNCVRVAFALILVLLLIPQLSQTAFANYEDEEEYERIEVGEGKESENGVIVGDEMRSEKYGKLAATLLVIGLMHPAFKYLAPFFIERKKVVELRRKYSLHHGIVMITSTLLAFLHHFSSEREVLGYPALILMGWLSITGALMKFSIHPETKRYAATMHFQKILTVILLVSLYLHVTVGD